MTLSRRSFLHIGLATAGVTGVSSAAALHWSLPQAQANTAGIPTNIHLLNRISFGPTPEEVTAIDQMGYDAYLEQQLNPEQIDDGATDALIRPYNAVLNLPLATLWRLANLEYRLTTALYGAAILRALHSKRQLLERMVEFWSDHFNVAGEEILLPMARYYNRDIRNNALGNFRALLLATAKSPAMLIYLDNYVNIAEHPNENYARELLELHTMGADNGYTEADVENVARAFTGWTTSEESGYQFWFNTSQHDSDTKQVLGQTLPAGRGIEDGLHIIDMLVRHPATAQYISRKLCIKFVSDQPPQSLVDSTAAVFQANDGEIKPVLRHLFTSNAFKAAAGQKLRRPFTFYIAALRAAGASIINLGSSYEHLQVLGQPPYAWLPPNGYPATATPWMTTNGLLARWNGGMAITEGTHGGDYTGLRVNLHTRIGNPATVGDLVSTASQQVFGYVLPQAELAPFIRYASDDGGAETPVTHTLLSRKLGTLYGLMIASPTFQWR